MHLTDKYRAVFEHQMTPYFLRCIQVFLKKSPLVIEFGRRLLEIGPTAKHASPRNHKKYLEINKIIRGNGKLLILLRFVPAG